MNDVRFIHWTHTHTQSSRTNWNLIDSDSAAGCVRHEKERSRKGERVSANAIEKKTHTFRGREQFSNRNSIKYFKHGNWFVSFIEMRVCVHFHGSKYTHEYDPHYDSSEKFESRGRRRRKKSTSHFPSWNLDVIKWSNTFFVLFTKILVLYIYNLVSTDCLCRTHTLMHKKNWTHLIFPEIMKHFRVRFFNFE